MPEKSRARYPNILAAPGHRASLSQRGQARDGFGCDVRAGCKGLHNGSVFDVWGWDFGPSFGLIRFGIGHLHVDEDDTRSELQID